MARRIGAAALGACPPFERAAAFYLFGTLQQFFFDGNKRASRFMMNGILMAAGMDAISVPTAQAREFNKKIVRFHVNRNGTEMMAFLAECHPDTESIRAANPMIAKNGGGRASAE